MSHPLISILTPSFNRAGLIAEAVKSVLAQDYPDFEHIIIDGASTDGTLDVLAHYPHLHIISEPDQGMYDAINKGLQATRGDLIGWLNSDDLLLPGAFHTLAGASSQYMEAPAFSGAVDYISLDSPHRGVYREYPAVIDDDHYWERIVDCPATNGWFMRPFIYEKVGQYNTRYRFIADREYLIRVALAGIKPIPIPTAIYRYRQHSGSFTISAEDSRSARRGQQRIRVLSEDLGMLSSFLGQKSLPPAARSALRASHSRRAYRLAATACYHRQFRTAARAIGQGCRLNPLWPFLSLRMAGQRLSREWLKPTTPSPEDTE